MSTREIVENAIGSQELADYLTAPHGYDLAVWENGWVSPTPSHLSWASDDDDAPVARTRCPGIGNLDSTLFSAGWATRDPDTGEYRAADGRVIGYLEEMIRECCRSGDVSAFREDLIDALVEG
jgi:hypothetical protein